MLEELEGLKVLRMAVGHFVVGRQLMLPVVVVISVRKVGRVWRGLKDYNSVAPRCID